MDRSYFCRIFWLEQNGTRREGAAIWRGRLRGRGARGGFFFPVHFSFCLGMNVIRHDERFSCLLIHLHHITPISVSKTSCRIFSRTIGGHKKSKKKTLVGGREAPLVFRTFIGGVVDFQKYRFGTCRHICMVWLFEFTCTARRTLTLHYVSQMLGWSKDLTCLRFYCLSATVLSRVWRCSEAWASIAFRCCEGNRRIDKTFLGWAGCLTAWLSSLGDYSVAPFPFPKAVRFVISQRRIPSCRFSRLPLRRSPWMLGSGSWVKVVPGLFRLSRATRHDTALLGTSGERWRQRQQQHRVGQAQRGFPAPTLAVHGTCPQPPSRKSTAGLDSD